MHELKALIRRARRRQAAQFVFDQVAVLGCASCGAVCLLLITGVQLLDWRWLLAITALPLLVSVSLHRRLRRVDYELLQLIDARLGLADLLSTAWHFSRNAVDKPLVGTLVERARVLATEADLGRVLPFQRPRALLPAAVLGVLALGLFGLRYGVLHTLSLQPPLARFELDFWAPVVRAAAQASGKSTGWNRQLEPMGLTVEEAKGESAAPNSDREGEKTIGTLSAPADGDPLANPEQGFAPAEKAATGANSEKTEPGEGNAAAKGPSGGSGQSDGQQASAAGRREGAQQSGKNRGADSNLLSKMRDAMANLLAKLGMQPPGSQGSESGSGSQTREATQGGEQAGSREGLQTQARAAGEGKGQADPKGDQEGQFGEQGDAGQSRSGERAAAAQPNAKSGMGKQEGNKDVREAEQLAALGKLSEILGKRAQQLSGEVSIEVPSGKQQLRTNYSQQTASHSNTGGEISRDEVPMLYQAYIRRYFEAVRKTAGGPSAKTSTSKP